MNFIENQAQLQFLCQTIDNILVLHQQLIDLIRKQHDSKLVEKTIVELSGNLSFAKDKLNYIKNLFSHDKSKVNDSLMFIKGRRDRNLKIYIEQFIDLRKTDRMFDSEISSAKIILEEMQKF
jgi:hypothetical protein